ncbi:hypothetical protein CCACVL1_08900 [Corchorus capsularis]|uniref:Uncharacterized protein n=1 Tax=Corchorus capsularis TaxID=210143 RepID=A0A1R3IYE0_COCAP|nr:hypothetical protein CCACVL1_08900 [Corchorus capsularis]
MSLDSEICRWISNLRTLCEAP